MSDLDESFINKMKESKIDRAKGVRKYLKDAIQHGKLNPFQDLQNKLFDKKLDKIVPPFSDEIG